MATGRKDFLWCILVDWVLHWMSSCRNTYIMEWTGDIVQDDSAVDKHNTLKVPRPVTSDWTGVDERMTFIIYARGYWQSAWCPSRLAKRWCNALEYRLNSPLSHTTLSRSFSIVLCVVLFTCAPTLFPSSPLHWPHQVHHQKPDAPTKTIKLRSRES